MNNNNNNNTLTEHLDVIYNQPHNKLSLIKTVSLFRLAYLMAVSV